MDRNENDREIFQFIQRGVIGELLQGEPVEDILGDVLPEQRVEDEILKEVADRARRIAKSLEKDACLNRLVDAAFPGTDGNDNRKRFLKVMNDVIEDCITWEKIIVLLYIAGKIIVKMIHACLPQSLSDILSWAWDFFQRNILSWIKQKGGWVTCISSLSTPTVQAAAIFICGILLGGFVMWRAGRQS